MGVAALPYWVVSVMIGVVKPATNNLQPTTGNLEPAPYIQEASFFTRITSSFRLKGLVI